LESRPFFVEPVPFLCAHSMTAERGLTSPAARFGVKRSVLVMRELKAATCMASDPCLLWSTERARLEVSRPARSLDVIIR